jgi:hypothetical protein
MRRAQLPGQGGDVPLTGVQHPQADVDLGDPPGHPVVGDGEPLGEPPHVVEPQRGVQEPQPDGGAGLPGWRTRDRNAHDRVLQRRPAVHPAPRSALIACAAVLLLR